MPSQSRVTCLEIPVDFEGCNSVQYGMVKEVGEPGESGEDKHCRIPNGEGSKGGRND